MQSKLLGTATSCTVEINSPFSLFSKFCSTWNKNRLFSWSLYSSVSDLTYSFFFFLNLHENANKMEKSLLCFQYYLQAKVCITSFYSPWLTCHSIRNTKRPKWVPYLLVIFTCVYASVENQKYRNQNVTCDFFRPAQENPVTHIIYDVTDQESKACNW